MPDDEVKDGEQQIAGGETGEQEQHRQQADPEVTGRATLYGWVPKEEFRGDISKWVPADVYIKRAEEILPIARAQNRKLEADLVMTKKELEEMRKTVKAVIQSHKKTAQGSYESQIARIEKEQIEAVSAADSDKWAKLEAEKKTLQKPDDIPFTDAPAGDGKAKPAFVTEWEADNQWYSDDPELGIYADSVSNFVASRKPHLKERAFLDEVTKEVRSRYPEKFGNKNRRNPPVIDRTNYGGGGEGGGGNGHTYNDLPADAKAACNETIKAIVAAGGKMTKEDYVRDYFG